MGKANTLRKDTPMQLLPSAIALLPVELLEAIFQFTGPTIPLRLCAHWRAIAIESPRLWQTCLLDARLPLTVNQQRASEWVARSDPLPFSLHLDLEPERASEMLLPLLSPFLSSMDRLRSCTISGKREDIARFRPNLPQIAGRLESLDIQIRASDEEGTSFLEDGLSTLSLCLPNLPEPQLMQPLPFTDVTITECFLDVSVSCSQLLRFLTALPSLTSLQFCGTAHEDESEDLDPSLVISLPYLTSLRLVNTYFTRTILSRIDAPALGTLSFEHLNVEFMGGDEDDESDDEDEGEEFSLSPASDRALGLGMRSLIERSHPPIKSLVLDYADMRSRDFAWCFDRLDKLEMLTLVGSDLSNTIISLLGPTFAESNRPELASRTSEEDEDAFSDDDTFWGSEDEESEDEERWGEDEDSLVDVGGPQPSGDASVPILRLPTLTTLSLSQCPRFTGELIVATLISRVLYTDHQKVGSTLVDVAILDCELFKPRNGQQLRDALGSRLRVAYA